MLLIKIELSYIIIMNNINILNVPADCRCFCLVNYNADSEVTDCNGKRNFVDLPLLEPIFAKTLEEAKSELAKRINVPVSAPGISLARLKRDTRSAYTRR